MRPILIIAVLMLMAVTGHGLDLDDRLLAFVEQKFGVDARERLENWEQLVLDERDTPEPLQVQRVNDFFNERDFVSDLAHWGESDYWATPVEFLATDAGDCEEYANAKYMSLRALGIPDEKLRVTYVNARHLNQAHMVLAYYPEPDAEPLILDNLVDTIQPASQRTDLDPVYSFNGTDLWLSRESNKQRDKRIGTADELAQWNHLRDRMMRITGK